MRINILLIFAIFLLLGCKKKEKVDPKNSSLKVTVLMNDQPGVTESANVYLYKTQQDWTAGTNLQGGKGDTSSIGTVSVTIPNLESAVYYIYAYGDGGDTDSPIITPKLPSGQTTEVTVDLR